LLTASIAAIEYSLPRGTLSNDDLASQNPTWSVEQIYQKTGIATRHIASPTECASDFAAQAADKLFSNKDAQREEVDFLIYCTQSPDHFLPTTACLLQERLGLPTTCGALDFNLGCSGYVYGLGLAQGLIRSEQARTVLLLTGDTYSRFLDPADHTTRTLFGDGASATLLRAIENDRPTIGPFYYGTDGSGAENLIARDGAFRNSESEVDGEFSPPRLTMNGPEIFHFTLGAVPKAVQGLLDKADISLDDVDRFVFHQANGFMLEHLRKKIGIPADKFVTEFEDVGNTVSSSIPIALKLASDKGNIKSGDTVMLVGFGVGYSWGATLVQWSH